MTDRLAILAIPNPFGPDAGLVRVLESSDTDPTALAEQLRNGTYDKPFIAEDGATRALHFCWRYTQSRMRIDAPVALQMTYTRMMMSFLLLHTNPRRLLLLGLGGGSLAKYCHHYLPQARITVVESNPHVLAFRDEFAVPPDDERFRVVADDAGAYVRACRDRYDVVLMDAFDRRGIASGLELPAFYDALRGCLYPEGIVAANVAGFRAERDALIDLMRRVWGDNLLAVSVEEDDNDVVFAFADPGFEPRWRWIERQAEAMRARYDIEFPTFARQLKRGRRALSPTARG
jgi:spermidine synthase